MIYPPLQKNHPLNWETTVKDEIVRRTRDPEAAIAYLRQAKAKRPADQMEASTSVEPPKPRRNIERCIFYHPLSSIFVLPFLLQHFSQMI